MPIYEFRCRGCRRKTTALVLVRSRLSEVVCEHCGGTELVRLASRFATPRSDEARLERLTDPTALADIDESDPSSVARWMKKMGGEMGEDLGDDVEQAVEEGLTGEADPSASGDES